MAKEMDWCWSHCCCCGGFAEWMKVLQTAKNIVARLLWNKPGMVDKL